MGEVGEVANKQPPSKMNTCVLVFDGGEVVEVANQQPPSETSMHMLISMVERWWWQTSSRGDSASLISKISL